MNKITVGQTLYRQSQRRGEPLEIQKEVVVRIGKKYFYLEGWRSKDYPINIETLWYEHKNYSQNNFRLYLTEQEIHDELEQQQLSVQIERRIRDYRLGTLPLEKLRAIAEILGIKYERMES